MIDIFSHRALFNGIENSRDGIIDAIQSNFGLELDLRCNSRGVYLSHDKSKSGELFANICPLLINYTLPIALHIKELECTEKIVDILNDYDIKNCFLFDSDYDYISNKSRKFNVALYVNSKPVKNNAKIFWCDEVQEKWYSKQIIKELHDDGKILYAVSQELVIDSNFSEIVKDWNRLIEFGFDGICTNFPKQLYEFLQK